MLEGTLVEVEKVTEEGYVIACLLGTGIAASLPVELDERAGFGGWDHRNKTL